MNKFTKAAVATAIWLTGITTLAYKAIGDIPSNEPFKWTIVPMLLGFTVFSVWLGWELGISHKDRNK